MSQERCDLCSKPDKIKLVACKRCEKNCCKHCIYIDINHQICGNCSKADIREQIINEKLSKCRSIEEELNAIRDKSQTYQFQIENLTDKCSKIENDLKSSEISHLEKINNLQINIQKAKTDIIPYSTIENLEKALQDYKKSEKRNKNKYEELRSALEIEQNEHKSLKDLEKILTKRIKEIQDSSLNTVPYDDLRIKFCSTCLKKIKIKFKDDIMAGHKDRDSVINSLLISNTEILMKPLTPQGKKVSTIESNKAKSPVLSGVKDDSKCNCLMF
jgi:DNA repair exonuclease SbcCD ATPase subunit